MKYRLSIIIPTKNRQKYCIAAIKQILSLNSNGLQIVVQDNSTTGEVGVAIDAINSENVKFHHIDGDISFVDNFSKAVCNADGDYLCIIGDDDCILPNILDAVTFADNNGYDAVIPALNAVYAWPSVSPIFKNAEKGYLCLNNIQTGYFDVMPSDGLKALMRNAGQDYQTLPLPRLYHGLIKRERILDILNATHKMFDGLSPDIYMAVALSMVCKKVCRLRYPITISGICPASGSADSGSGKHTGALKDAPHFRGHADYEWDKKVPAIYTVETIWAETCLHAVKNFSATKLYDCFRMDVLDGLCLAKYGRFKKEIAIHIRNNGISWKNVQYQKFRFLLTLFIKTVWNKLSIRKANVQQYYNIENIKKAQELTMECINR